MTLNEHREHTVSRQCRATYTSTFYKTSTLLRPSPQTGEGRDEGGTHLLRCVTRDAKTLSLAETFKRLWKGYTISFSANPVAHQLAPIHSKQKLSASA